jgi:hypothetical protein
MPSQERRKKGRKKKQNNGLLDTRRAIELVITETAGEKALKEAFPKRTRRENNKRDLKVKPKDSRGL